MVSAKNLWDTMASPRRRRKQEKVLRRLSPMPPQGPAIHKADRGLAGTSAEGDRVVAPAAASPSPSADGVQKPAARAAARENSRSALLGRRDPRVGRRANNGSGAPQSHQSLRAGARMNVPARARQSIGSDPVRAPPPGDRRHTRDVGPCSRARSARRPLATPGFGRRDLRAGVTSPRVRHRKRCLAQRDLRDRRRQHRPRHVPRARRQLRRRRQRVHGERVDLGPRPLRAGR